MGALTYNYEMRVRSKRYLWGGDKLTSNLNADLNLFLTIHLNEHCESLYLGQSKIVAGNITNVALGELLPGQVFSIALNNLCGVYADPGGKGAALVNCSIQNT